MHKKVLLIINPVAGKGNGVKLQDEIITNARRFYPAIELFITSTKNDALQFIQTQGHLYTKVFVAGGDGTLNEIVKGISPEHDFTLYILPIGSGNDFARANGILGMKNLEIFQKSTNSEYFMCDIGHIRVENEDHSHIDTHFFSSCGSGFDAIVARLSNRKSILTGLPLYISSVFIALIKLSFIHVTIKVHDAELIGEKLLVTIGNTSTSGGGFKLTPFAKIDDGKLDCMIAEKVSRAAILKLLPKAILGKHVADLRVTYKTFKKMHISYKTPSILHVDGEILSEQVRRAEINIKERAVKLGRIS